tara:strand:- start:1351 stop:1572 length:222 start_codon:yes stop_codon:yes gene_type:complete
MLLSETTFNNGTEVDLTNGEHTFPNMTLRQNTKYPECYVIENYMTREVFATFNNLYDAVFYCNVALDTNFKLS